MAAIAAGVRDLASSYFALVMATGILSIACRLEGMMIASIVLTAVTIAAAVVLGAMNLARALFYWREVCRDLSDHNRGVGFFTLVAGSAILGCDLILVVERPGIATWLWVLSMILWVALTYAVFTALTIKEDKPALKEGINGGWLIAVVATESVANLALLLAPTLPGREQLLFLALSLWLCGGMLYIWMISLIFYRYTFFRLAPSDLMPPYWVNMGAMAISTLVGARLVSSSGCSPLLSELLPFIKGFTVLFWATATWWIPMLVILGFWRHVVRKFKFAYDPLYWGAVFPLGMYAVATHQIAEAMNLPFLLWIPRLFTNIAIAAWLLTASSLAHSFVAKRLG